MGHSTRGQLSWMRRKVAYVKAPPNNCGLINQNYPWGIFKSIRFKSFFFNFQNTVKMPDLMSMLMPMDGTIHTCCSVHQFMCVAKSAMKVAVERLLETNSQDLLSGAFKFHISSIICACTGRSIKFQKSISEHVGNQVKLSERIISLTYGMTAKSYLDVYTGGSETSSTTVDWAMTEMLKHPRILQKAQNEIRVVVSRRGMVDGTCIEKIYRLKMRRSMRQKHLAQVDVKCKPVDFGNACPEVLLGTRRLLICGHLHAYALNLQLVTFSLLL
ncbi:cytochrome P450 [Artemisia annua]|uniref:Cytochrome P450 n=1 Tax=Artemisia annua TaxID=35608 RepID=A0A2U1N6Z6_ARTAN|nr:cytochrome P450 [Artemisia annua]